jgi:hypothetical protein
LGNRDDIRRYVSRLDQVHRMFGHHRDAEPETPEKQIGGDRTEEALNAELAALEADNDDKDE